MTATTSDEQDARDMDRLAAGQDASLNDLMQRHAERLFHYLIRSLQNETEAADVAQESFVRVYQNRAKFNPRQKFSTWLYSIATNLARDHLRWRSRHPHISLDAESAETGAGLKDTLATPQTTPAEALQAQERAVAVRQALASLSEELRAPLILAEYEERSQAEIALILNCSAKAVEMRIYRARQQLREKLGKSLKYFE
ncbi:MAG: sigma-70 family RNA polymerase sigma factor [Verrucomicrobia bacterium]|nr:sigma-70 family RNA polymerase sigma factor [Verrucomicrobiota bacterium]